VELVENMMHAACIVVYGICSAKCELRTYS